MLSRRDWIVSSGFKRSSVGGSLYLGKDLGFGETGVMAYRQIQWKNGIKKSIFCCRDTALCEMKAESGIHWIKMLPLVPRKNKQTLEYFNVIDLSSPAGREQQKLPAHGIFVLIVLLKLLSYSHVSLFWKHQAFPFLSVAFSSDNEPLPPRTHRFQAKSWSSRSFFDYKRLRCRWKLSIRFVWLKISFFVGVHL